MSMGCSGSKDAFNELTGGKLTSVNFGKAYYYPARPQYIQYMVMVFLT